MMGLPSDIDEMFNEDQLDRDNATEEDHKFLRMSEELVAKAYGAILDSKQYTLGPAMAAGAQVPPEMMKPSPNEVLEGLNIQPRDFENHVVHLETHNRSRKTKAYKKLPKAVQALYDEHCDLHAMFLLPPPPPPGAPPGPGDGNGPAAHKPASKPQHERPGNPAALQGRQPPGGGGAGGQNAQGNLERREGMRPTPSPPGANNHHLTGSH
jgi:hypothetical protein